MSAPPAAPGTELHGLVVASYRRHFAVRLDDGEEVSCVLKGRNTALACGDRVVVARSAPDSGSTALAALVTAGGVLYFSVCAGLGVLNRATVKGAFSRKP